MSIILEALRKAEATRRGDGPLDLGVAPVRRAPFHTRIPLGFVVAAATLFLSVGVGAWLLWPDEPTKTATVAGSEPPRAVASREPAAESPAVAAPLPSTAPPATSATTTAAPQSPGVPPAETATTSPTLPNLPPGEVGTAPAGADVTDSGAAAAVPVTTPAPKPAPTESPAGVRTLAGEARAADPTAPAAAVRPRGGSVEVRDLMGTSAAGDAAAATAPRVKPGSVEVRDLLAEQGVAPAQPGAQSGESAALLSDVDGGVRQPGRPLAAKPASAARPSAAPPGATLPPQAALPVQRDQPDIPSLDDLVASGQLNPPDISLDMHAYGPDAATRFVYINMRRYHIGDTTREGAVVEDITPDGVVLELQGRRFALSAH